jgi:hypothetical protein
MSNPTALEISVFDKESKPLLLIQFPLFPPVSLQTPLKFYT